MSTWTRKLIPLRLLRAVCGFGLVSSLTACSAGALGILQDDERLPYLPTENVRKTLPTDEYELAVYYTAKAEGRDPDTFGNALRSNPLGCWPIESVRTIRSPFGMRRTSRGGWRMHKGIDIAAPYGTPILAAGEAIVISRGVSKSYGKVLVLEHDGGVRTRYAHMRRITAHTGQVVHCGDKLGEVGSTGRSTGPHLHFEIITGGKKRDPLAWVDPTKPSHPIGDIWDPRIAFHDEASPAIDKLGWEAMFIKGGVLSISKWLSGSGKPPKPNGELPQKVMN